LSERIKEVAIPVWLLFIPALILFSVTTVSAQNIEGQPIASQYSTWQVSGYAPDTYTFAPNACRVQGGASFFNAFTVGTPIKIVDGNPALTEMVTPTNVINNNNTCSISIAPVNHHNLPYYLTSATGGLQEALNANHTSPAVNTIILDNKFYVSAGSANVPAVIASAIGFSDLGLVDITQVPYVWYQWNGSHYVAVSTGQDVTSVFGRTGAVTGQTGDYTCLQVIDCNVPNAFLPTTLSASVSSSATTIPLASVTGLTQRGEIVIDGEWIAYSGISGSSLTGATRGIHQTTPASYSAGATVYPVVVDWMNPAQSPFNFIIGTGGTINLLPVFGCNIADQTVNALIQFGCPDSNLTFLNIAGGIQQTSSSANNTFISQVGIGPGGGTAPITNSGYLFDSTRQNQSAVPQGFGGGIAGPVESVQPTTIAAPTITNFAEPVGSTTWSYECTGTDADGDTYPGTIASISDGPAVITSGEIIVQCPFSAGAASETIWRTAGGPNQGSLITGTQPAELLDTGGTATSGSPPATNSSIPKICTAGEQFCEISGTTSTPTVACSSTTRGWTFHNVSSTTSPFAYVCNGTTWGTAY
jgi:hypothetical protein